MNPATQSNDYSRLYTPEAIPDQDRNTLAGQALGHLADAWAALEALEAGFPEDLPRWDAESFLTARKGTQRAWLALSNLNRSLLAKRGRDQGGDG
jgi:hypothetical protein